MHRISTASKAVAPLVAALLVAGLAGCSLFGKKSELYTESVEARPLEVPPDLDRPSAERAMTLPSVGSTTASAAAPAAPASSVAPIGFNAPGERDAVYVKVGDALAAIDGVTIASKAQILGTYDIDYMGSKFLVRVTKAGDGAYVSAVDPRGLPPTGEAPVKLIGAVKSALGQ